VLEYYKKLSENIVLKRHLKIPGDADSTVGETSGEEAMGDKGFAGGKIPRNLLGLFGGVKDGSKIQSVSGCQKIMFSRTAS